MRKILVVDDHTIFRQGIVSLFQDHSEFTVVGEAGTGESAVRLARTLRPDCVVMDIVLPDIDGITAARRIQENGGAVPVVLLSMHRREGLLDEAASAGVRAYLLKDDAFTDLVYAIKAVLRGDRFESGSLARRPAASPAFDPSFQELTTREREVLVLLAEGRSTRQIADRLYISPKTVETHRSRIMEKLGLRSVADLVRYAIRVGILDP